MRLIDTHPRLAPVLAAFLAALIVAMITFASGKSIRDEWAALVGTLLGTYIGVRSVAPPRRSDH